MLSTVNNGEKINLYRGDYEKIEHFKIKKTNKGCLFGPGIYLTTDDRVAHTYRVKGNWLLRNLALDIEVNALNKNVAMELFLKRYISDRKDSRQETLIKNGSKDCSMTKVIKLLEEEFELGLQRGHLIVRREARMKVYEGVMMYVFVMENKTPSKHGWISSFEFDKRHLRDSTVQIDASALDKDIYNILENPVFWKCEKAQQQFLKDKRFGYEGWSGPHGKLNHFRFIDELLSYGYQGYRHNGGIVTNSRRHEVYILFDDQFVNQNKLEVFK